MRASNVEYHAPARFDDLLEIFVRLARIGRTSATYECAAYRMEDDLLMVTATQTLVLVDLAERAAGRDPGATTARPIRVVRGSRLSRHDRARHTGALEAIERVLNRGGDADDVLREVVAILHERLGRFVRISFVEEGALAPGPSAGDDEPRHGASRSSGRAGAWPSSRSAATSARRRPRAPRARGGARLAVCARRLGHRRRGLEPVVPARAVERARAAAAPAAAFRDFARSVSARADPDLARRNCGARPSDAVAVERAPQVPQPPPPSLTL